MNYYCIICGNILKNLIENTYGCESCSLTCRKTKLGFEYNNYGIHTEYQTEEEKDLTEKDLTEEEKLKRISETLKHQKFDFENKLE